MAKKKERKKKLSINVIIFVVIIIIIAIILIIKPIFLGKFTGNLIMGSPSPSPSASSSPSLFTSADKIRPKWNLPSTITTSPNYRTLISIINVPPFITSTQATLTRQNRQKITLFSLPSAEYYNPDLTLNTFLPKTLSNGEKIILDFIITGSDNLQYTESSTYLIAQETPPNPTPSASPSPSPSPFCNCKNILLIATEGGDAKPQQDDTEDFGVKPEDLALKYLAEKQALQLGFIIKATCVASSEEALALCNEGQEVKSTTLIEWDDATFSVYCKSEQFNPKNPIVRRENPKARCYDPEVDKNTDPKDDTKVAPCLGKNQLSPGFGDDNFHEPHNFPNGKKAKIHKKGKGNEWIVKWIDFPGLIVPTTPKTKNSNVKATGVISESYYHAYVIGQDCPITKNCNICFTLSGEFNLNNFAAKTLKTKKVPCKLL